MESGELNQMISVVKKYYELGMNQEQIAKEEFISKSSVCRLIKKAVANGYVRFRINYPMESVKALETRFLEKFDLQKAFIAPAYTKDQDIRLRDTCKAAAQDLCRIVRPDDIISTAWGSTMDTLAGLIAKDVSTNGKCSKIVMMNGSSAGDLASTKSSHIIEELANFFAAEGYLLPVPLVVDSERIAQAILHDSHVSYVLDFARQSRVCVFAIGTTGADSVLIKRSAYIKEDYNRLVGLGAVGNIAGHCYDINGNLVDEKIDSRLMGLGLPEIVKKEIRIGIGVGVAKAAAIAGALRGGMLNRLYTDELTATQVLKQC